MHEITKKLIERGFYFEKDGHLLQTTSWPEEKFEVVANMKSRKHGIIVLGQPKTGNHLTMAILDAFGIERAEELDKETGISNLPFEDQRLGIPQFLEIGMFQFSIISRVKSFWMVLLVGFILIRLDQ